MAAGWARRTEKQIVKFILSGEYGELTCFYAHRGLYSNPTMALVRMRSPVRIRVSAPYETAFTYRQWGRLFVVLLAFWGLPPCGAARFVCLLLRCMRYAPQKSSQNHHMPSPQILVPSGFLRPFCHHKTITNRIRSCSWSCGPHASPADEIPHSSALWRWCWCGVEIKGLISGCEKLVLGKVWNQDNYTNSC